MFDSDYLMQFLDAYFKNCTQIIRHKWHKCHLTPRAVHSRCTKSCFSLKLCFISIKAFDNEAHFCVCASAQTEPVSYSRMSSRCTVVAAECGAVIWHHTPTKSVAQTRPVRCQSEAETWHEHRRRNEQRVFLKIRAAREPRTSLRQTISSESEENRRTCSQLLLSSLICFSLNKAGFNQTCPSSEASFLFLFGFIKDLMDS